MVSISMACEKTRAPWIKGLDLDGHPSCPQEKIPLEPNFIFNMSSRTKILHSQVVQASRKYFNPLDVFPISHGLAPRKKAFPCCQPTFHHSRGANCCWFWGESGLISHILTVHSTPTRLITNCTDGPADPKPKRNLLFSWGLGLTLLNDQVGCRWIF